MRGQGMKYAHAISDGRQGVEGDLEKSKRQIKRYKETVSNILMNHNTRHQKQMQGAGLGRSARVYSFV